MPPSLCSFRFFLCKLLALFLLLYALVHLIFFMGEDLDWMPPPADLTHVTDSPKKKHPDGPLVLKNGILGDEEDGGGTKRTGGGRRGGTLLVKAVLMDREEYNAEGGGEEEQMRIKDGGEDGEGAKRKGKKRRNKLPISEQFLTKFRQTAKQIHQRHSTLPNGFVLFSLLNRAYLDLTLNWLCNLYGLQPASKAPQKKGTAANLTKEGKEEKGNDNKQMLRATLLVALDGGELCKELKREWPEVSCLSMFEPQKKVRNLPLLNAEEQKAYNEALSWGRLRYVHLLTARANLMAALAEAKVPFVLAESDAIWLRNPFPSLFANANLIEDADVVMPLNSRQGSTKGERFAFDPMLVFATTGSRRLLQEMRRILNQEPDMMDQELLNRLCEQQYMGVVCREFEQTDVADGAWFKLSEPERTRAAEQAGHWPFIVNNNFYVGVHNKMARQAINGLWFLSAKQKKCNLSKTKRVLQKYEAKIGGNT